MADEERANKRARKNNDLHIVLSVHGSSDGEVTDGAMGCLVNEDDIAINAFGSFDYCLKRFKEIGFEETQHADVAFEEWCTQNKYDIENQCIHVKESLLTIVLMDINSNCMEKE